MDDDFVNIEFKAIGDDGAVMTYTSRVRMEEVFQAAAGLWIFEATISVDFSPENEPQNDDAPA